MYTAIDKYFNKKGTYQVSHIMLVIGRVTNLQKSAENSPEWEMTIKFMKETVIHYGPWLDRQRDILYKFFYPPDYKVMEVNEIYDFASSNISPGRTESCVSAGDTWSVVIVLPVLGFSRYSTI